MNEITDHLISPALKFCELQVKLTLCKQSFQMKSIIIAFMKFRSLFILKMGHSSPLFLYFCFFNAVEGTQMFCIKV